MSTPSPTHDQITTRAKEIWEKYGRPEGRDEEIWLEAERQLAGGSSQQAPSPRAPSSTSQANPPGKPASLADRVIAETAAESTVEYHISPAVPAQDAVKEALEMSEPPFQAAPVGKPAQKSAPPPSKKSGGKKPPRS